MHTYVKAAVRWFLSIDENDFPKNMRPKGYRTYRSLTSDGEEIEFSDEFTELHTMVYKDILLGGGFGLEDNKTAIETVTDIRNATPKGLKVHFHP